MGRPRRSLPVPARRDFGLLERHSQAAYSGTQWEDEIKLAQVQTREVLTVYKAKLLHQEASQTVTFVAQKGCSVSILGGFQDRWHKALSGWSGVRADSSLRSRSGWRPPEVPSNPNSPVISGNLPPGCSVSKKRLCIKTPTSSYGSILPLGRTSFESPTVRVGQTPA